MDKELQIILGPTAVGKTDYSIDLALEYASPVISCDSRQIYKELKIGTAPPSPHQLERVRHYFIFSHSVQDFYTAGRYEIEAMALLKELFKTHDTLIMSGGSCLYVDALCHGLDAFPDADIQLREKMNLRLEKEGLVSLQEELRKVDPVSYDQIDLQNPRRVVRALEVFHMTGRTYSSFKTEEKRNRPFRIKKICLERPRTELYDRINRRVDRMIEEGLVDEVRSLIPYRTLPALNTVGYREIFEYLDDKISLDKAVELIKRNSRHYAKKQMTWWRNEQKTLL